MELAANCDVAVGVDSVGVVGVGAVAVAAVADDYGDDDDDGRLWSPDGDMVRNARRTTRPLRPSQWLPQQLPLEKWLLDHRSKLPTHRKLFGRLLGSWRGWLAASLLSVAPFYTQPRAEQKQFQCVKLINVFN